MESTSPVVSIIVPVYNSGLYLEDCLSSIVKQTCQPIEIIIVNDGSTDRSQEIIDTFASEDDRIVALFQTNQGVSAARNTGLRVAKGEYILFVDSDDTMREDAVEVLCRHAVETGADIVIGNVRFCYPDGKQIPIFKRLVKYSKQPPLSGVQCFIQLIKAFVFPPLVYLYFIKRDLIQMNRLFFEEGIVHEDELWCIKTLIHARQVTIADFFHYSYFIREGSIMHSDNKEYRVQSFFRVVEELEIFIAGLQHKDEHAPAIGYIYVRIFYNYLSICRLLQEIKVEKNEYREYFGLLLKKVRPALSPFQQKTCTNYFLKGNLLLQPDSSGLTLSFCITCKNRFYQIAQTLRQNLEDNRDDKDLIEFVLVDFGSTDGLQEWVAENFTDEIEEGYLKYYYSEQLPFWDASVAKNTSHILAENDIVVNLDCDNFTGKNGGLFVMDIMVKYGLDSTILHQFSNEFADGSYGRIALSKANFLRLGGYDESFEPSGCQDKDLLLRAQLIGLKYINISDMEYNRAISNTLEEKTVNISSHLSWEEMEMDNFQLSVKNITSGKLIANKEKEYLGAVDDLYTLE